MRQFKSLAFIITSAALLAACKTPVKLNDTPVVERTTAPQASTANDRDVRPVDAGATDELNNPGGVLANRSIYFDFDSYAVRDDGKPVVENHSNYLVKNKTRHILIQGNTDERGGTEYNLALGQKRAEAVRKSMSSLGVTESQMEAVSLGEEKPKATGSNEEAWAQNRRADIVYQ
jgi:peptidoglycan-associated lipoprotein